MTPGSPTPKAFCTSCGSPVTGARFCTSCGSAVPAASAAEQKTQAVAAAQVEPEHPTQVIARSPEHPTQVIARDDEQPAWAGEVQDAPPPTWFDELPTEEDPYVAHESLAVPPRGRRRGRILTAAFLVVVLLAVAGFFGYQYLRDADVRQALDTSTREYNVVLERLAQAKDVAGVSDVAKRAATAAEQVEQERARIEGRDDDLGRAATAQLDAEHEVLTAAAALVPLAEDPLQTWAGAHGDLRKAVREEAQARDELQEQDESAAGQIADSGEMLQALTGTVGAALADDAAGGAVAVLDRLAAAGKTSGLREIGDDAVAQQDAVSSVADALTRGSGREVLAGYADVLDALGGLSDITAADTSVWPSVRSEVETAADALASAAGPQGGKVRATLAEALRATDAMLLRAEQGYARWELERDAAAAQLADDRAVLDTYEQDFTFEMEAYATGREELGEFTDRLEDGTADVYEGRSVFGSAVGERQSIQSTLSNLVVPAAVQAQHDAVVALVGRGVDAVTAGYEGLDEAASCFADCPDYRATEGWRTFLKESEAISKQYDPVLAAWQKALGAARTALESRAMPAEPDL